MTCHDMKWFYRKYLYVLHLETDYRFNDQAPISLYGPNTYSSAGP